jgi:hypothetical protein
MTLSKTYPRMGSTITMVSGLLRVLTWHPDTISSSFSGTTDLFAAVTRCQYTCLLAVYASSWESKANRFSDRPGTLTAFAATSPHRHPITTAVLVVDRAPMVTSKRVSTRQRLRRLCGKSLRVYIPFSSSVCPSVSSSSRVHPPDLYRPSSTATLD